MSDRPVTDGERWVTDALTALRDQRFAPTAITTFLARSRDRAADTRTHRPALVRQARAWSALALTAALALRDIGARHRRPVPSRGAIIGWVAAEALMLDWHLGMVEGPAGEPRPGLSAADALTLARGTLAPFAATAPPDATSFLLLLGGAAATDLLDGHFARRAGTTRFGRDFDPIADLAFRGAALHGARRVSWIGRPAACALAARQLAVTTGAAWHWFTQARRPPIDPRRLARWDAPPLLVGLALAAQGHRRFGDTLILTSAAIGTLALAGPCRGQTDRVDGGSAAAGCRSSLRGHRGHGQQSAPINISFRLSIWGVGIRFPPPCVTGSAIGIDPFRRRVELRWIAKSRSCGSRRLARKGEP